MMWWLWQWLLGNGLQHHQRLGSREGVGKATQGSPVPPRAGSEPPAAWGWLGTDAGMCEVGCAATVLPGRCTSRDQRWYPRSVTRRHGTQAHCCHPMGRRNPRVWGHTFTCHPILGTPFPTASLSEVEIPPTPVLSLDFHATEPGVSRDPGTPRRSHPPPLPTRLVREDPRAGTGVHGARSRSHLGK